MKQLIDTLCSHGRENEWLEFKVNHDQPQLIGEYLSALSNSACLHDQPYGYLVFGIDDQTLKVIGTDFRPHIAKGKGNEGLEPWLARLLAPRVDFRILESEDEGRRVVIFQVEATINTPVKFRGVAFVRVGEHKHRLSEHPEKERKIWRKAVLSSFEEGIALTDQNADKVLSLIDYPAFFDLLNIPLPDNRAGIFAKLEEEQVVIPKLNRYDITNLGAILFAKELNEFPGLKRKALRVIVYEKDNRLKTSKDKIGKKGYAAGFEGLVDWIDNQLPINELIENALRVNRKMYPKVAIREFVANAIIHQDFSITGAGPMVEIFPTRIEITNPGEPLVDIERFIDHAPRSRNEILAALMRRMNICEERGSGVDRAIDAIEDYQLPAPEFQAETDFTRVTMFAHQELKDMEQKDRVRACYQHCCLRWVSRDFMTNASLRQRLGISRRNYPYASRIIRAALDYGVIKTSDPENRSNKKKYVPFWT